MSTEVRAVIFAEDFRSEASGQVSAIGMFPPVTLVEKFPWTSRVAVMLAVKGVGAETMSIVLRAEGGAEFARAEFEIGPIEPDVGAFLHLPPRRITLSAEDSIQVLVGLDGEEPTLAGMFKVALVDGDDDAFIEED